MLEILLLKICLNGILYETPLPIYYQPSEKTVYIESATNTGETCFSEGHDVIFKDGFEN